MVGGSSHVIKGEVILPAWDELALQEEPHDGHIHYNWAFAQDGNIDDRVEFDTLNKEIRYDVTDIKKHTYNQTTKYRSKPDRLWELLLDNQSTCDVIIN